MRNVYRRDFLRQSSVAAALAGSCLWQPAAKAARPGAEDRIGVALIGCGGMGCGDLETFLQAAEVDCPVVCDVDEGQIGKAVKLVESRRGQAPKTVRDFRRVLDDRDVDVCLVATPDHWHALPSILACQAGKDVYVEKPLATSIGEGRAMVAAAHRHNRVVQMGTQWRSGTHFVEAVDYLRSGRLGTIRLVHAWACLSWFKGVGRPSDTRPPEGVDYDFWLGPAPLRPFNPARFHFNFRWFWDYAGGLMTDWGVHLINLAQWAMQVSTPTSAAATGGKYVLQDSSETPDTQCVLFEYPGFTLLWEHQAEGNHGVRRREHGVAFDGVNGTLVLDANGWEVIPGEGKGLEPVQAAGTTGQARFNHVRNFLDCVRSRERPVTDVETGHYATTTAHLGNIAFLKGRKIRWDGNAERVIGDPEADVLLMKPYRKPWELPSIT